MAAFKCLHGRWLYVDMSEVRVPGWKARKMQKAAQTKTRELKKIDPFARCLGRHRVYQSADELRIACEGYFKAQETPLFDKNGVPLIDLQTGKELRGTKPLTLSGLGRHIGVSTQTLRYYEDLADKGTVPPDFAEVIYDALQRIEEYAEGRSYDMNGSKGAQFVLERGFNWQSKKGTKELDKIGVESKVALEKLKMQQEKHELEMQILKASLDSGEDSDIHVTIKRATREE